MTQSNEQYVDGFLLVVPSDKIEAYRAMATRAAEVWKEHGALDYRECVGDQLDNEGHVNFRGLSGAGEGETVVFAWIVYANRAERDRVNTAVMADPRLNCEGYENVFDLKRMAWGGFRTLVQL